MKKIAMIFVSIILCMTTVSCQKRMSDDVILHNLNQVKESTLGDNNPTTAEIVEDMQYSTGVEGLCSPDLNISGSKYYFLTKHTSGNVGVEMISYIDWVTGEYFPICPDPLCAHEEDSDCKYTEFQEIHLTDTPGVFYSIRKNSENPPICRIDINKDTVETVYTGNSFYTSIVAMDEGKLYFYEIENIVVDKQNQIKNHYYYIDTATNEITDIGFLPEKFVLENYAIVMIHKGEIYYHSKTGEFKKTDFSFKTV